MANRIKKGDHVIVTAGKDKGKKGDVVRVIGDTVVVSNVNIIKRHTKPNPQANQPGGVIEIPGGLGDDGLKKMRAAWRAAHQGRRGRAKHPPRIAVSSARPPCLGQQDGALPVVPEPRIPCPAIARPLPRPAPAAARAPGQEAACRSGRDSFSNRAWPRISLGRSL